MTDDERCYVLLRAIRQMAGLLYPFSNNSNVAPDKAEALFKIVNLCSEALHEHDRKRDDSRDFKRKPNANGEPETR